MPNSRGGFNCLAGAEVEAVEGIVDVFWDIEIDGVWFLGDSDATVLCGVVLDINVPFMLYLVADVGGERRACA